MRIWQLDPQFRTPINEEGDWYYWTNTFYCNFDAGIPSSDWPGWNDFIIGCYSGTLDNTELVSIREMEVSTGVVYGIPTPSDNKGYIPAEGGGQLLNTARLVGWSGGKAVSYKRWRFPLRTSDLGEGVLAPGALSVLRDTVIPLFISAGFTNIRGDIIDNWTCDGLLHMWQLRHGTKRRTRVVYDYPH